jgi:hypothetical protein
LLKCTSPPPPFYKKEGHIEHILGKHIETNPNELFLFFITKGMEIYGKGKKNIKGLNCFYEIPFLLLEK